MSMDLRTNTEYLDFVMSRSPARARRALIYTRISEDKTGEALGVARQNDECQELCEQRGWIVVDTITENGVSASKGKRPGFAKLLDIIGQRTIDVVVVWAADRLVRQPSELETLISACELHGVKIATATGDLDLSTDTGRLVARILVSVARNEIERKSARLASKLRETFKAGAPTGGPRAFGYDSTGLHLELEEASVVADLFARFNTGATLGELCRMLNANGVATSRGNAWTTGSMRTILLNPRYCGLRGARFLARDEDGRPVLNAQGQQVRTQFHEVLGSAVWPAIVDESAWRAASDRLKDTDRRKNYRGSTRKYLLSGMVFCAVEGCGRKLKTKVNNQARAFFCPSLNHVCRKAEPVETYVKEMIIERLRQPDALDLVQERRPGVDLRALRDESAAIRERLRDLARAEVLGQRSADEVQAARDAVTERLTEIDRTVADAGRVDVIAAFVGEERDPADVWRDPRTTLAMKQALITALAMIKLGSGQNGRPAKYTEDEPPPRVFVEWHKEWS